MRYAPAFATLSILILAACEVRDAPVPDAGPAVPVAPAAPGIEGRYTLAAVGADSLPATTAEEGDCRWEVLDASLRMEAGRFAFQSRTRQICDSIVRDPVTQSAGGTYDARGDTVALLTDIGGAFSAAHGTAGEQQFTLRSMRVDEADVEVDWRFRRD